MTCIYKIAVLCNNDDAYHVTKHHVSHLSYMMYIMLLRIFHDKGPFILQCTAID